MMKWNWFSPLPPAGSEIANLTARLVPVLQQHAEVTLWTDQEQWDRSLEKLAPVRRFDLGHVPWRELNRADLNVYHLGNHLYHARIWQISRRLSGVTVLHDALLHDLFYCLYHEQLNDRQGYLDQMKRAYGPAGADAAWKFCQSQGLSKDVMAERFPLTTLALENAAAAVVHTPNAFALAQALGMCPVRYLPLPYAAPADAPDRLTRKPSYPVRLVIFGFIGYNRQLDVFLRAWADSPVREHYRLDVYGSVWNEGYVKTQIHLLGLTDQVTIHGFVPEAELETALRDADLAINLRHPTRGEASASQLRIWAHALPSLVTADGWFATLPPDATDFVRPGHEKEDIKFHLAAYLSHRREYLERGRAGRLLLERDHVPEAYVRALAEFGASAVAHRGQSVGRYLVERTADEMVFWPDRAAERSLLNVGAAIHGLLP